jgi:hypothetical protein
VVLTQAGWTETVCSQLMARSIYFIDHHDIDGFVGLFDEKGSLTVRNERHVGHDDIRRFMQSRDPERITRHIIGAPAILIDGDSVRGVAYFALYEGRKVGETAPIAPPHLVGEFHQEYREAADGWRLLSHRAMRVFDGGAR